MLCFGQLTWCHGDVISTYMLQTLEPPPPQEEVHDITVSWLLSRDAVAKTTSPIIFVNTRLRFLAKREFLPEDFFRHPAPPTHSRGRRVRKSKMQLEYGTLCRALWRSPGLCCGGNNRSFHIMIWKIEKLQIAVDCMTRYVFDYFCESVTLTYSKHCVGFGACATRTGGVHYGNWLEHNQLLIFCWHCAAQTICKVLRSTALEPSSA